MFRTQAGTAGAHEARTGVDRPVVAAIAAIAIAAALGVALARYASPLAPSRDAPALVELAFKDRRFAAPETWFVESAGQGARDRISLRIPLSDITGVDHRAGVAIGLVLTPADAALAPSERPRALYARFLSAEAQTGPGGLIRRRFREGTPYEGETLLVAPPEGRVFSARCPAASPPGVEPVCFAELRFGDVDAHLQIPLGEIDQWERVAAFARTLVVGVSRR